LQILTALRWAKPVLKLKVSCSYAMWFCLS
jgi:hypothetical protein